MQETTEVPERLEALRLSWFHRKLLMVCGFGFLFDQMDSLVIGTAVVSIAAAWRISSAQNSLILSASYLGLFVGSLGAGVLSDYFGRKKVFQYSLLIFCLLTGLAAFSQNVAELVAFRFLIGLGLGGEIPVVASLVSEIIPKYARGRYLSIMSGFNAFGALAAALIGAVVVPYKWGPLAGWQVAFLIGAVPALFVWWVRRGIPESPRWLQARGRQQEALGVVERVEGPGAAGTAKPSPAAKPSPMQKSPLLRILERDVIRSTLLSWVTWFCVSWVFFAILVWVPTLLVHVQGFTVIHSLQVNLLFNFMGVPGFLCVAYLVEHVGRKKVLVGFIALSAVSIFLWGHSATTTELLSLGSLTYFATAGMMTANVVYTAELFPTSARGTGVGAAAGWGRISAYFGIVSVAPLLSAISVSGLYSFYTILLIIPMVAIPIFGRESKGKQLEAISA